MKGLFICFEGGDGAGKTTQSTKLAESLRQRGYEVVSTFEPGDTGLGAEIRGIVLHSPIDIVPRAEALLYAADKAQHVSKVISPALGEGKIVICDRYVDSTIAYQGAGRAIDDADIRRIAWWSVSELRPDLTVLMDASVAEALGDKDELDRMESAGRDFHERVRSNFLRLAAEDPARYLVVHGRGPIGEVAASIAARVDSELKARGIAPSASNQDCGPNS